MPSPALSSAQARRFGDFLKRLRETKTGWSQQEVAKRTGLSANYISMMETGVMANPTLAVIQALADAYGVEPGLVNQAWEAALRNRERDPEIRVTPADQARIAADQRQGPRPSTRFMPPPRIRKVYG